MDEMIPRNGGLKTRSGELRNNATLQEKRLWYEYLRKYRPHFYRQRIIGNYIVDFYCPKARLVIEIDGARHFESEIIEYDKERTEFLNSFGLLVLRFTNVEIDERLHDVCVRINNEVKRQTASPAETKGRGGQQGRMP